MRSESLTARSCAYSFDPYPPTERNHLMRLTRRGRTVVTLAQLAAFLIVCYGSLAFGAYAVAEYLTGPTR